MTVIIVLITLIVLAFCIKLYQALNWKQPPLRVYPKDLGFKAEDITFQNSDGITLKGWFIPCKDSAKTLVLMHGFEMDKSQILPQTINLAKKYNLFYFDFFAKIPLESIDFHLLEKVFIRFGGGQFFKQ